MESATARATVEDELRDLFGEDEFLPSAPCAGSKHEKKAERSGSPGSPGKSVTNAGIVDLVSCGMLDLDFSQARVRAEDPLSNVLLHFSVTSDPPVRHAIPEPIDPGFAGRGPGAH